MCATRLLPIGNNRNKLALVIGINKYGTRNDLINPENDACDMAIALRRINFDVKECLDATYADIECSLKIFIESIDVGDMVLFFFAGHGQQWEDQNYLIPSNDDYIEGETIKEEAFNVQKILNQFAEKKPFVIIALLDCCRDYHLRNWELRNVGRGLTDDSDSKGLKRIYVSSTTTNCLIAFACAAGHTASDLSSNGRNGLFTWHLLQHIKKSNQDIAMVLRDVAQGVYNETKNNETPQDPWINCSLKDRDIFLNSVSNLESDLQSRENDVKEDYINELNEKFNSQLNLKPTNISGTSAVETPDASIIEVVTKKNDNFISQYAKDYHTIKVLGKGSYGCVFEVVNKFDGRHLAVKRISLKNERQQQKALKEVQALGRLDHSYVIRYLHTWIETPPPGWQKAQDDTYDWRDISRNDRNTTTNYEATNTSTMASTMAGTAPFHTHESSSESHDLNYFLKMPSPEEKSFRKDASQIDSAIQESGRSKETNKTSQEPIVAGLVNLPVNISIDHEDDQQVINEASSVQVKQDSTEKIEEISYLYYSMELCSGDTLEHLLSPSSLTKEQTCNIVRQITEAVVYIHNEKMIHGDIKPANIFFSATNSIKIGDFGLAVEMLHSNQAVVEGRRAHGTYWYMAPELLKKEQKIQYDEKVDIYAMGIVFLELLSPFKTGTDRSAILAKIRKHTKKNLDVTPIFNSYEKATHFNLDYEPIIARLLNPLASERPSAKDLLEDKSFCRMIKGIHVDKFLPSARLIREIYLPTSDILHGHFACSGQEILLCESDTFSVFNTKGQVLSEIAWTQNDYHRFGHVACITWSTHLNAFLVLSNRALFTLIYSNFQIRTMRHSAIYASNKQRESKLRFITCASESDYLFLNRGYHTIQQYKMVAWTVHREWTQSRLNYLTNEEIRDFTADRHGEYLVMNVCINGTTWVIDVRATDDDLTLINRIEGFHHKLQLFSPSNYWLFVHGDPNRLYLYDIRAGDAQVPKEVLFGDNEDNPQFSFSKTAPINFRWLGNTHLVLGTPTDNNQRGVLKLYST